MTEEFHELSITRYIAAPATHVWQIFTERLSEWWCPKPWRTEVNVIDWRAGGRFETTMFGPEGEEFSMRGLLLEVEAGKRIVFTDAINADWQPQPAFMIGIMSIEAEGDGTRYRALARHWSEEAKQRHLEMGFVDGWSAVADQLAELAQEK